MANDPNRTQSKVFGDIDPDPATRDHVDSASAGSSEEDIDSMDGGSQHDRTKHSGSRSVTEGVTGGTGTETGGTRNFRQGTGATGGDIGNRPEVYKPK
jgi:hypothetical protein